MSLVHTCSKNRKPAYELVLPQVENILCMCTVHCNLTLQCSLKCLFFIRGWLNFTDYAHYIGFSYQLCSKLCRHNWESPTPRTHLALPYIGEHNYGRVGVSKVSIRLIVGNLLSHELFMHTNTIIVVMDAQAQY